MKEVTGPKLKALYGAFIVHSTLVKDMNSQFTTNVFPLYEYILIRCPDAVFIHYAESLLAVMMFLMFSAKILINGILLHESFDDSHHQSYINPVKTGSHDTTYAGKPGNQFKPISNLCSEFILRNRKLLQMPDQLLVSQTQSTLNSIFIDIRSNIYRDFYRILVARGLHFKNIDPDLLTIFRYDHIDNQEKGQYGIFFKNKLDPITETSVRNNVGSARMQSIFSDLKESLITPSDDFRHDELLAKRTLDIETAEKQAAEKLQRAIAYNIEFDAQTKEKNKKKRDRDVLDEAIRDANKSEEASVVPKGKFKKKEKSTAGANAKHEPPPSLQDLQQQRKEYKEKLKKKQSVVFTPQNSGSDAEFDEHVPDDQGVEVEAINFNNCRNDDKSFINNSSDDSDQESANSILADVLQTENSSNNSSSTDHNINSVSAEQHQQNLLLRRQKYHTVKQNNQVNDSSIGAVKATRDCSIATDVVAAICHVQATDTSPQLPTDTGNNNASLLAAHKNFAATVQHHVMDIVYREMAFDRKIVEYVTVCNLLLRVQLGQVVHIEWADFMDIIYETTVKEMKTQFDDVLAKWNAETTRVSKSMDDLVWLNDQIKLNKQSMVAFRRSATCRVKQVCETVTRKLVRECLKLVGVYATSFDERKYIKDNFQTQLATGMGNDTDLPNELTVILQTMHVMHPESNALAMQKLIDVQVRKQFLAELKPEQKPKKAADVSTTLTTTQSTDNNIAVQFDNNVGIVLDDEHSSPFCSMKIKVLLHEFLVLLMARGTVVSDDNHCLQINAVETVKATSDAIKLLLFIISLAFNSDDDLVDCLINSEYFAHIKCFLYVQYNYDDYDNTCGDGWCYYTASMQLEQRSVGDYSMTVSEMKQLDSNVRAADGFETDKMDYALNLNRLKKSVTQYYKEVVTKDPFMATKYNDRVTNALEQYLDSYREKPLNNLYWGNLEFVVTHQNNITGFNGVEAEFEHHLLPILAAEKRWAKLQFSSLCPKAANGNNINTVHKYGLNEIHHIVDSAPANYLVWRDSHFFVIDCLTHQQSKQSFRNLLRSVVDSWLTSLSLFSIDNNKFLLEIVQKVALNQGACNDQDSKIVEEAVSTLRSISKPVSKSHKSITDFTIDKNDSQVRQSASVDLTTDDGKMDLPAELQQSDLPEVVAKTTFGEGIDTTKDHQIEKQKQQIAKLKQELQTFEALILQLKAEKQSLIEEVKLLSPGKPDG